VKVESEQLLAPGLIRRLLARVVVALLPLHVGPRERVEEREGRRVEAVLGDAPEHAAVPEAAAGVGRVAGQQRQVVTNVWVRIPIGVDGLREVAQALQWGGTVTRISLWGSRRRWNSWLQKKKSLLLASLKRPGT